MITMQDNGENKMSPATESIIQTITSIRAAHPTMLQSAIFLQAWHQKTHTFSARALAQRIDPNLVFGRNTWQNIRVFIFSDQSYAHARGRGPSFQLQAFAPQRRDIQNPDELDTITAVQSS